ncbi:hypothetical protein [Antarcticirhabdus aurantiaca]|uniref:Uncharacterized protein n=1 Tax=Antarcticirhabdus aurantiaca TaxID=2606717 RepID=A0ACD4NKI8_9HYPH|nr:hypothetical protein [Antarcticirhabdus aurantiaca]WAJ27272.1 hypothetical protein OXU80_20820 [Jeongeuplla avenae]
MDDGIGWRTRLNREFESQFPQGTFHFAVGNGWSELLGEVFRRVDAVEDEEERVFFAWADIKEKWGLLRLTHNGSDRVDDICDWAEAASERICDGCGLSGRLRKDGLWRVRCDACAGS